MQYPVITYFDYDAETELPDEGVAIYNGKPHYFWLRTPLPKPRTAEFDITPIEQSLFDAVSEFEAIWRKWDFAYHGGEVELHTHPGVQGNSPRFADLKEKIASQAKALRSDAHQKCGKIELSENYVMETHQRVGKKWPVSGMRSAELAVVWQA